MKSKDKLPKANSNLELLQFTFCYELSESQQESIQGGATDILLQGEADAEAGQATGKRQHEPIRFRRL